MNKTLLTLTAGAALFAFAPAVTHAQAAPAAPTLNDTDKAYLMEDAQGSIYDQATAELAVMQAMSPAVQQYATRLVYDHDRLNMMMLQTAQRYKIVLPLTLQSSDSTKLDALKAKTGADFDKAYLQEAVQINADDVKKATAELDVAKDPQIYAAVLLFRDTEVMHEQMAQDLLSSMK